MVEQRLFPYPLPETLNIGNQDPLDYKHKDGQWVHEPEWWREIGQKKGGQTNETAKKNYSHDGSFA